MMYSKLEKDGNCELPTNKPIVSKILGYIPFTTKLKMKITEDNITQLKNYWGNRTVKDIIPSEMKITVSDVREWFNGFLNENGKRFKTGKIFYKTKGLTNFNRRVGIGYATYYPFIWMDYGRKGFETVRIKSIIS